MRRKGKKRNNRMDSLCEMKSRRTKSVIVITEKMEILKVEYLIGLMSIRGEESRSSC
jgi:hypothetical protein